MHITVKFTSNFRSFRINDLVELRGDFIAITGENGSGKSQLLSSITTKQTVNPPNNQYIDVTEVNTDNQSLTKSEMLYCSFKGIGQPPLSRTNYSTLEGNKNSLFNVFQGHNLNDETMLIHDRLHKNFRDKFGDNYRAVILDQNSFIKHLPSNFFNDTKNIFTTDLNARFYQYAREVRNFQSNCFKNGQTLPANNLKEFYEEKLGKAPWTFFNELFEKIGFEYRFDDNYELDDQDAIEQINLKHIKDNQASVEVNVLSDGEIALFSLFVAFLRIKYDGYKLKLVVLDEYDAPFNPLLIKQYITMLNEYFVN